VFDGIIRMMEPSIKEKGIHFTFTKKGIDWAWMNIDAERVQQIFVNLLSNAVKFTHSGGLVSLTMECLSIADGMVTDHFVVKDDGIGMSDEFQKHMFEPFAQEHRRDSEASGGSGLGLSIVSQLVSLMGGVICVDSAIGKGTEFAFNLCFPIADKPTEMKVLKTAVDSSTLKGKRILLCEDHPLNASIAVRILERVSAKVDVERNGKDGFERFLASVPGTYDAILMDIRMPVMDGLEATQAIRSSSHAEAKTIPIIAMSANAFDSDIETAQDVGMDGYVVKPVEPDDLYKKLAEAISGK
jgi:CheY-like chemotaxis protein